MLFTDINKLKGMKMADTEMANFNIYDAIITVAFDNQSVSGYIFQLMEILMKDVCSQ